MKTFQRIINYTFVKLAGEVQSESAHPYYWTRIETVGSGRFSYSMGYETKDGFVALLGAPVEKGSDHEKELEAEYQRKLKAQEINNRISDTLMHKASTGGYEG